MRCVRGRGTSAARRSMNVSGSKTTASVHRAPDSKLGRRRQTTLPSQESERRSVAMGGAGDVAAEPFEALAFVGADLDLGVQRETTQVAAEQAWDEARAVLARPAQARDGGAAAGPEGHAALDRSPQETVSLFALPHG